MYSGSLIGLADLVRNGAHLGIPVKFPYIGGESVTSGTSLPVYMVI